MNIVPIPRGCSAPGNLPILASRAGGMLIAFLIAIPALFPACSPSPQPASQPSTAEVSIQTGDGFTLAATLYAGAPGSPGLVVVHALGSTRQSWDPFARKAREAGYSVIAFDMRGHGQTTANDGPAVSYRSFTTDDWLGALHDIDAARACLGERGANPENTVVAGASIGANLALRYAVEHSDVPAVVMISPGLDYKGVATREAIAALGQRPVLLMTSAGDAYSASSCATLKGLAPGHCELREYAGTAHGVDLLDMSTAAAEQVFLWLEPIIGP